MNRQLLLTDLEILNNPSVNAQDEIRLSNQAYAILRLLQKGPVTTSQLAEVACQYNARIFEVRQALRPLGLDVKLTQRNPNGNNVYEIVTTDEN